MGNDVHVILPTSYTKFSKSNYVRSDISTGECSSDDNGSAPDESDPLKISVPCELISPSLLKKIIAKYQIPPDIVYRVLDSNEYISTLSPLDVAFC